jgi:hypothetical protein
MASAGVALLQDIKMMFGASTLDYVATKIMIANLTADPEKQWAEWRHGRPINDKGVADLLREFHIISKTVGPKDGRCKGYRKADFEDAWERYLVPQFREQGEGGQEPSILPFTRSPHCNDYEKDEKGTVHQGGGERVKIDAFFNKINVVNGRAGKTADSGEAPSCTECGKPSRPDAPLRPHGYFGELYHGSCWQRRRPAPPATSPSLGTTPNDFQAVLEEQRRQQRPYDPACQVPLGPGGPDDTLDDL